jgi:hypothetical protein
MSALPPKADMCSALGHVCFGPIADMPRSLDYVVGAGKQLGWDSQVERLCSPEVDG